MVVHDGGGTVADAGRCRELAAAASNIADADDVRLLADLLAYPASVAGNAQKDYAIGMCG